MANWPVCRNCTHWSIENYRPKCKLTTEWIDLLGSCPDGLWGPVRTAETSAIKIAQAQVKIAARRAWAELRSDWVLATNFATAIRSRIELGEVDEETFQTRKDQCLGNPDKGIERCTMAGEKDGNYFCQACGCPANQIAKLGSENSWTKLHYIKLPCPLGKPGFWEPGDE